MNDKIKYYAGIGSRETPPGIEPMIEEIVKILNKFGYILRSGGADGSDSMFEKYCEGDKEMSGCGKGCAGCLLAIPVLLAMTWIINKFVFGFLHFIDSLP